MEMLRWSSEDALKLYARINSEEDTAWRDAAAVQMIDSVRSGTILRERIAGDTDARRADLLDAASRATVSASDVAELPPLDIDRPVAQLEQRSDAIEAAARRQDALTAADSPSSLEELLDEVRGDDV